MTPDTTFPETDTRRRWVENDEARAVFRRDLETVERLRFLEIPEQRTLTQAALGFVLAHPGATVAIPGAKNPAQAVANARAADLLLSPDELACVADVCPLPPAAPAQPV
jgi:aryl-alcohol dehydrogenase-like predicted oxidoreductase